MDVVKCSNRLCGKEYSSSFNACPFCGTKNETYVTPTENENPNIEESFDQGLKRYLKVFIVGTVALSLGSTLLAWLNLKGTL